jgi:hypothetical protein
VQEGSWYHYWRSYSSRPAMGSLRISMAYDEEKGNVMKIFVDYGVFILFES